jgi:hypothetical protein
MVHSPQMMRRRLREGVEFFQFLRQRRRTAHTDPRTNLSLGFGDNSSVERS